MMVPAAETPQLAGKEITMQLAVIKPRTGQANGTVITHGNQKQGYGIFLADDKIHMLVKQNGKPVTITAPIPEATSFTITGILKPNGSMVLQVDGKTLAEGKGLGPFKTAIPANLRVGFDGKGEEKLGPYPDNYDLVGNLGNSFIEVGKGTTQVGGVAEKADVTIHLKVVKDQMQFDKKSFSVKAGQVVELVLENTDFMLHNWVLTQIGMMNKVGAAADKMASDPKGAEKNYIPQMPEVIAATELVNPDTRVVIRFKAPEKTGDYPYVCTFPGHWRIMNGTMKVLSAGPAGPADKAR
jgi:azurin